jgi:thioredoxin 1
MNKVVVVKASWCGPCKAYAPTVESATEDINSKGFDVEFIDADEEPDFCQRYGIRGVPSTLFFKNGELANTLVGAQTKEKLLAELV